MIEWWDYWFGYEAPYPSMGTATTLHIEPEPDAAEQVRQVAEEVTGKPVPRPEKPRMGFL